MRERYSGRHKFEIEVTNDRLEARCNLPFGPKRNLICFGAFLIGLSGWGSYRTWLSQDSHGYSNWWRLTHHYSVLDFGGIVMATVAFGVFLLMGVRLICPAGAILICDREQVKTTRIPWYSFTGRWITRAYNVLDVSGFRLKLYSSVRGQVYGIRFFVNGSTRSIFVGSIEPPEAYRILVDCRASAWTWNLTRSSFPSRWNFSIGKMTIWTVE